MTAPDTTIAPGVTYVVAICVTKQDDPTAARAPDAGRNDVALILSASDGGPMLAALATDYPDGFPATDSGATMPDPLDARVTGQKYLATIPGSATGDALAQLAAKRAFAFRYATVGGEPMRSAKLLVTPTA